MKQIMLTVLGAAACALLLSMPATAAEKAAPATHKTTTMAAKKAERSAWPPENLSGKIAMVDAATHRVVVTDSSGTPFDMIVTPSTRIRSGDQSLKLDDLASRIKEGASVHFVPERQGDVARSIQVTG